MNINDKSLLIDHKNRNTLDNRKENLRVADYQKNSFNKSVRRDNTTGTMGVEFNKRANKWRAKIKYNNVTIHLGYFIDLNEAILNRRVAEEYLFKDFSPNEKLKNVQESMLQKAKKNVYERINKKVS